MKRTRGSGSSPSAITTYDLFTEGAGRQFFCACFVLHDAVPNLVRDCCPVPALLPRINNPTAISNGRQAMEQRFGCPARFFSTCLVGHIIARGFFGRPRDTLPHASLDSLLKA